MQILITFDEIPVFDMIVGITRRQRQLGVHPPGGTEIGLALLFLEGGDSNSLPGVLLTSFHTQLSFNFGHLQGLLNILFFPKPSLTPPNPPWPRKVSGKFYVGTMVAAAAVTMTIATAMVMYTMMVMVTTMP